MREPKTAWTKALRLLTGCETDTVRYNEEVNRWEFVLMSGDGISRSQFWGWFRNPFTGQPLEPDDLTGMYPFRELDDDGMIEALANLEKTFVGNPHDGHTTTGRSTATHKEVRKRMAFNRDEGVRRWKQGGEDFAAMAAERGHRLRGALVTGSGGTRAQASRQLVIPNVIGGRG